MSIISIFHPIKCTFFFVENSSKLPLNCKLKSLQRTQNHKRTFFSFSILQTNSLNFELDYSQNCFSFSVPFNSLYALQVSSFIGTKLEKAAKKNCIKINKRRTKCVKQRIQIDSSFNHSLSLQHRNIRFNLRARLVGLTRRAKQSSVKLSVVYVGKKTEKLYKLTGYWIGNAGSRTLIQQKRIDNRKDKMTKQKSLQYLQSRKCTDRILNLLLLPPALLSKHVSCNEQWISTSIIQSNNHCDVCNDRSAIHKSLYR